MAAPQDRVVLARLGAPHGIRGEIRLKSFTGAPEAVADYGPLDGPSGETFEIEAARPIGGDMLVVRLKGVRDRDAAERLTGTELSLPRSRLPSIEDEDDFYHADLIGLLAVTTGGHPLGTVIAIHNHGAGDIVEIGAEAADSILVPFTREAVPVVDIAGGRLVVDPPAASDTGEEGGEA